MNPIDKTSDAGPTLADVQWLRTRRRLAVTYAEQAAVRARMIELASGIKERRTPANPLTLVLGGIAVIVVGLLAGVLLFHLADAMWVWLNS